MPTDPFVAPELDDDRARSRTSRPACTCPRRSPGAPTAPATSSPVSPPATLLGRPGPNVGYALTLAEPARATVALGAARAADDALAVIAELAMKRAASFGRAPTMADVEFAADAARLPRRRRRRRSRSGAPDGVHGADHDYGVRRAVVDAVPDAVAADCPPKVPALLGEFRGGERSSSRSVELRERLGDRWSGSGSRPRRRARSTSAARAHRALQLALSPAITASPITAARSCSASRTPTSPAAGEEWVLGIQDTLRWLGLDWDEGPYLQSERFDQYLAAADRLLARGSRVRVLLHRGRGPGERNDAAVAAGRPPGYDGHCRDAHRPTERAGDGGRGSAALDPVPHPRRRGQQLHRPDPR